MEEGRPTGIYGWTHLLQLIIATGVKEKAGIPI